MIRLMIIFSVMVIALSQSCLAAMPALNAWGGITSARTTLKQAHKSLACYQKLKAVLRCDRSDSKSQKSNTSKRGR